MDYSPYQAGQKPRVHVMEQSDLTFVKSWTNKLSRKCPIIIYAGDDEEGKKTLEAYPFVKDLPVLSDLSCEQMEKMHTTSWKPANGAKPGRYTMYRMTEICQRGWDLRCDPETERYGDQVRPLKLQSLTLL